MEKSTYQVEIRFGMDNLDRIRDFVTMLNMCPFPLGQFGVHVDKRDANGDFVGEVCLKEFMNDSTPLEAAILRSAAMTPEEKATFIGPHPERQEELH